MNNQSGQLFQMKIRWYTALAKIRVWRWRSAVNFSHEYRDYTNFLNRIDSRLQDYTYMVVMVITSFRKAGFTTHEFRQWFHDDGKSDFAEAAIDKFSTDYLMDSASLKQEIFDRCIMAMALGINRNDIIPVVLISMHVNARLYTEDSSLVSPITLTHRVYQNLPVTSILNCLESVSLPEIIRYIDADIDVSLIESVVTFSPP